MTMLSVALASSIMLLTFLPLLLLSLAETSTITEAFSTSSVTNPAFFGVKLLPSGSCRTSSSSLPAAAAPGEDGPDVKIEFESEEDKERAVGNLVADDEWLGLSMELSEIVRAAVVEDVKAKTRDFIDKDEYKVGDIAKEIDARVKDGIASVRNKDEYELGDLMAVMDEIGKDAAEQITGKPYEFGDLTKEIDSRVKDVVTVYTGKDEYEVGDLSSAVQNKIQARVEDFTGKPYEFGDIAREVANRRMDWVKDYLGEEAASKYQFGDVTKKFVSDFTGKEKYQFGDISKTIAGNLFGSRKDKN